MSFENGETPKTAETLESLTNKVEEIIANIERIQKSINDGEVLPPDTLINEEAKLHMAQVALKGFEAKQ